MMSHEDNQFVLNIPSEIRSSVPAYIISNAAFTVQARKAARQLNVTLANHAEIDTLLQAV